MQDTATLGDVTSNAARLPTGTATFLFTDIEGSTQRWDRDRVAMQDALRRHDALVRVAIESAGGTVFKTIGDAFCAVFWSARDAVAAAVAAQRVLAAEDFSATGGVRVRMAIHTGTTDERDADYFGPTVNRVARLLSIAHGGQVILSRVAASLARPELPADATLLDLGEHRLKDLSVPEEVFQLCAPGLDRSFPKLRSIDVREHNLPLNLTEFFGRTREIDDIEALLQQSRLVTIFGAGGLGKTRIAVQVAGRVLDRFAEGVWFVDLAPIADATLVPSEVAAVFDLSQSANRPVLETVVGHLKNKTLLLVIDNCEHVVIEAAQTVDAILRACPGVRILATSREALHVSGEAIQHLAPLPVPEATRSIKASEALAYSGVALFDSRARASLASFVLTDDVSPLVSEVCRRLDGIPLAIELAAARVKVLGIRQLAQKLDERFRLLTGGSRTALKRQQTLRALIDWSYDLLDERERRVFRYLSLFAGSFSLESATAACADDDTPEYDVLDLLASLVDKSLVLVDRSGDESRYRLLESMRAYGREKLVEHGELREAGAAHARAYVEVAEALLDSYARVPFRSWLALTGLELENMRAALAWAFGDAGDVALGQRLAATVRRTFVVLAAPEARRWVRLALERVDASTPPAVVADLELSDAHVASILNQHRFAQAAASRALALYGEANNARGVANGKRWLGRAHVFLGNPGLGETLLREALDGYRELGYRQDTGPVLRDLAIARSAAGDVLGARAFIADALKSFNESGDEANAAVAAGTLAEAEYRCGDVVAALRSAEEALSTAHALGRHFLETGILCNVAAYLAKLERYDDGLACAFEALKLAKDVQSDIFLTTALQHVGTIVALRGTASDDEDAARAARLLGYVDAKLAALEASRDFTEQSGYDAARVALQSRFDDAAFARYAEEGALWSEDRAVCEAENA